MVSFGLSEYLPDEGVIIIDVPSFDFDSFPDLGDRLIRILSATVKEKQTDADLHTWLIDFEGTLFFLKAGHYSESVWLEALRPSDSKEVIDYIADLFRGGLFRG